MNSFLSWFLLLAAVPTTAARTAATLKQDHSKQSSKDQPTISKDDAVLAAAKACTKGENETPQYGVQYQPLDMHGQDPTEVVDLNECKKRCSEVAGCAHFSYSDNHRKGCNKWRVLKNDRGCCHLQDNKATEQQADNFLAGKPICIQEKTRTDCTCSSKTHVFTDVPLTNGRAFTKFDRNYAYKCEIHMFQLPWKKLTSRTWAKCTSNAEWFNPLAAISSAAKDAYASVNNGEESQDKNDFRCTCGDYEEASYVNDWKEKTDGEDDFFMHGGDFMKEFKESGSFRLAVNTYTNGMIILD